MHVKTYKRTHAHTHTNAQKCTHKHIHSTHEHTQSREPSGYPSIRHAAVLLNLGDSVTTDHISPAGSISRNSPAARYLAQRGVTPHEFNSYGARRGNDAVMARGTFANIRLVNKLVDKAGPKTKHFPSGDVVRMCAS